MIDLRRRIMLVQAQPNKNERLVRESLPDFNHHGNCFIEKDKN